MRTENDDGGLRRTEKYAVWLKRGTEIDDGGWKRRAVKDDGGLKRRVQNNDGRLERKKKDDCGLKRRTKYVMVDWREEQKRMVVD